ncbi:MAG: hypothetical protein WCX77_02835 [Candidatus Paceibacterota bacterium]|jgi:hypothetical protein
MSFITQGKTNVKYLAIVVVVVVLVAGGIFWYQQCLKEKIESSSGNIGQNSGAIACDGYSVLLNDIKNLEADNIIVSDWEKKFAVYLRKKDQDNPLQENGGALLSYDDLVILDVETGERKLYDVYKDLTPPEMLEGLEGDHSEAQYSLFPQIIRWSPSNSNVFWGKIFLYPSADPPIAKQVSFFRVDIEKQEMKLFPLPNHGLFGRVVENTNTGRVIYESIDGGLSLYAYDLETKKEQLIVSYSKEVFDKYCKNFIEYVHDGGFYGNCDQKRSLSPAWSYSTDFDISYSDFITGEQVDIKLDKLD